MPSSQLHHLVKTGFIILNPFPKGLKFWPLSLIIPSPEA